MAHKVHHFDIEADFDMDGEMPIKSTLETESWEEAEAAGLAAIDAGGSYLAVSIVPDPRLFATLADYLRALNAEARHLEANPKPGTMIGLLTEDLDHWAAAEVTTPLQMAAYLDIEVERSIEKSRW